ncbi:type II secretion system protein M [Hespellia stercorisuis]|uniref:Type II secretion system (T2SS), protein M n=1 Tax=Hespellia stercorisuis DSM 15480 TaxID=1121950 RepID=A0A1M6R2H2_9FIRM|nr:type II secretion system protein M [Hespellia stercorisuis]SHK26654.1 Type II secretion system (T2SS), protein M [Hespellia stercorisuis DSM 15480]
MINRRFTLREKILLLVCAVILLGIFYYKFVYVDAIEASRTYSVEDLDLELQTAQAKVAKMQQMQAEIDSGESQLNGTVATYNNLENEIAELNRILASADTFNLDFADATLTGDTVRRDISVSFHTGSYASMKNILLSLKNCQYRSLIKDVDVSTTSTQSTGINNSGDLNVSLTVTFYETAVNATSTAGLVQTEETSDTGTSSEE